MMASSSTLSHATRPIKSENVRMIKSQIASDAAFSNIRSLPAGENMVTGVASPIPKARRTACDVCRERKVRCDGDRPSCHRCLRLGHQCSYSVTNRQSSSKMEVTRALATLHARLAQAEVQLTAVQPLRDSPTGTLQWPVHDQAPEIFSSHQMESGTENATLGHDLQPSWNFDADQLSVHHLMDYDQLNLQIASVDDGQDMFQDAINQNTTSMSEAAHHNSPCCFLSADCCNILISNQQDWKNLYRCYFDRMDTYLPMVDQVRFLSSLSQSPRSLEMNSLTHAIAMFGASMSNEYRHLEQPCYLKSRGYLEIMERRENSEGFMNLPALQAYLLVAFYEIRMQNFARAWMSVGRAIRLTQMLGLHRMDPDQSAKPTQGFEAGLPATQDDAELEERRSTFWFAFCLDWYASMRTGATMTIQENEISTKLPSLGYPLHECLSTPKVLLNPKIMYSDQDSLHLSPFGGVSIMAALGGRCLNHIKNSQRQGGDNYSFWTEHYEIDRAIVAQSERLLDQFPLTNGVSDANILFLNVMVHATAICLHEAAIVQAEQTTVPATVTFESERRCQDAAKGIISVMKQVSCDHPFYRQTSTSSTYSDGTEPSRGVVLADRYLHMSPFITWCLFSAVKMYLRIAKRSKGNADALGSLQFLVSAMIEFERASPGIDILITQVRGELEHLGVYPQF